MCSPRCAFGILSLLHVNCANWHEFIAFNQPANQAFEMCCVLFLIDSPNSSSSTVSVCVCVCVSCIVSSCRVCWQKRIKYQTSNFNSDHLLMFIQMSTMQTHSEKHNENMSWILHWFVFSFHFRFIVLKGWICDDVATRLIFKQNPSHWNDFKCFDERHFGYV